MFHRTVFAAGLIIFLIGICNPASAQIETDFNIENELLPEPSGAFWRSIILPGWGHRYVDKNSWKRGQWHLGSEIVLVLTYVGLRVRANNIEDEVFTFARNFSGTDIKGRERLFVLAVSEFDDLQSYNDFQARSRQFDDIFPNTPEFQWDWQSTELRQDFRDLRDKEDRIENQLPAVIGLMLVNRVVSAISASNKAKEKVKNLPEFTISKPTFAPNSYQATIRFGF